MASIEEGPLLASPPSTGDGDVFEFEQLEDLYQRFSPTQKRLIVGLIAYAGLFPCKSFFKDNQHPANHSQVDLLDLASGSFIPSIPEMARELDTTDSIIR